MPTVSRVTRTREEARQSYDGMSRWYDLFTNSEKKFTNLGLEMLDVQSGESILEIGFGTGYALLHLVHAAQPTIVHGIDLSSKMCSLAEIRLQRTGMKSSVHLQTGDASHLPYKNVFFDAVFISFTLELFDTPEIPLVLKECQRVLKNNGRLGVVALKKQDCRAVRIYEWFHQRMPKLVDCRPIHAKESLKKADFQIINEKEMKMWGLPVSVIIGQK